MTYSSYTLILSMLSVFVASGQAAPKAPLLKNPAAPTWKPAPALLSRLDAPFTVGRFELRPPKGYVLQRQTGPAQTQALGWVGPARDNGVRPYLMLGIVTVPATEAGKHSVEQSLDKFLQSIQKSRGQDWKRNATEHGTVNGLPFVRARWSGSLPKSPFKVHGFNYVTLVKGQVIQLSSQDVEPDQREPLALAEAAALTFKRTTR
jgi:hypothetical protein